MIVKAAQELNVVFRYNTWVPNEDVVFGFKLYSSVLYCPSTPADAAKLSHFFGNPLTNHSLNTAVGRDRIEKKFLRGENQWNFHWKG